MLLRMKVTRFRLVSLSEKIYLRLTLSSLQIVKINHLCDHLCRSGKVEVSQVSEFGREEGRLVLRRYMRAYDLELF